jgi:hypothetical protein
MLAFAAAELVTAWGRVLREPRRFGFSLPFAMLSLWLLFTLVLHWFGLWAYREVPFDAALHSLLVLLPALVLALLAQVLTPAADLSGPRALHQHYTSVGRPALVLASLVPVLSGLLDRALPGVLEPPPLAFFLISAISLFAVAFVSRIRVQTIVIGLNTAVCAILLVAARL